MANRGWLEHRASRWALGALGVLVLVNVVAALALLALRSGQGDVVLANVTVAGEPVGGATQDELAAAVDGIARDRAGATIRLVSGDEQVTTDHHEAGVRIDADATTAEAWRRGRRGLWRALSDHLGARFGWTNDVPLDVDLDEQAFDRWTRQAAGRLSRDPRPAAVDFTPDPDDPDDVEVVTTEARRGQTVRADDVADVVAGALDDPGPLVEEVPAETTEAPEVTEEDLEALLPDAQLAVSAPVTLRNPSAGDDLVLRPRDLAAVLDVEADPQAPEGERLRLTSDAELLRDHLDEDGIDALQAEPADARFVVDAGEVAIRGGRPGLEVDLAATAERVVELATEHEPREGELPGDTTEPGFTREDAAELEIVEEVSSFSTPLVPGQSRNVNIQRAVELIRGDVIRPGERYSLDEAIGPRTRERGFVENGFIEEDGDLGSVVGGGTSQVATTFLNAAWFAGVAIIEFQPHSQYFERYPEGRESTISRGTIDVLIENDSPHGILIWTAASEEEVTISFWSTSWAEVDSWSSGRRDVERGDERDGFEVDFGRTITYPDGSEHEESHTHRYEPADD